MAEPSKDLVVASNAYSRASLTERQQYVLTLSRAADLLPAHLRGGMAKNEATGRMEAIGNVGKTFFLAETGDMLGIHPMAAVIGVHIIDGKPSISANLMTGLVRKAGHKLRVWVDGKIEDETLAAHAQLIRSDDPDFTFNVTWTLADAKKAGLYPGKAGSNWDKYTRAMLKSRVTSEIVREGASDVLMGGNIYTPEELGATVTEDGEVIDMPVVSQPGTGEPRPETPIVDEPATEGTVEFDWVQAIADAQNKSEVQTLYRRARDNGLLMMEVKIGRRKPRPLGEILTEVGKAFAEAEANAPIATESDADDPNVVDAVVVEDDTPAVLADEATGEVQ